MKWQQHQKEHGQSSLPSSPAVALRHVTSMYPNIRALISILCTLPVTSCSAERSFSSLNRIKTPFRSSMTTQWLMGLTLLTVHCDISVDIAAAIEFSRQHPRRLEMVNILNDWPWTSCASTVLCYCDGRVINWGLGSREWARASGTNEQRLCAHNLRGGVIYQKWAWSLKFFTRALKSWILHCVFQTFARLQSVFPSGSLSR